MNILKNTAALRSKLSLLLVALLAGSVACAANHPPVLEPVANRTVYIGETLALNLKAADPDGDQVTFSTGSLPANAFLDRANGVFTWTPSIDQIGQTNFVFTATDNNSPALSASIMVAVRVIFRTLQQEKDWGFGVKAASTVFETSNPADLSPRIARVTVDGQAAASTGWIETGGSPTIKIDLTSPYNIDRNSTSVLIDGADAGPLTYSDVETFGQQQNVLSLAFTLNPRNLAPGEHTLLVRSGNSLGAVARSIALTVGTLRLIDLPLVFPSPYAPERGGMIIQYTLSQNADINILIVSSTGEIIKKLLIDQGTEGGRAGLNKVPWDGRGDNGLLLGNGIYLAAIIDRASNKVLNKAKVTVYR